MTPISHASDAIITVWSFMTHYPYLIVGFLLLGIGLFNIIAIVIERR